MERFDVLVVGAGPAGSATAIRLAHGGARTLLVDKKRFPRDKPCGGGLTGRALRHAPCDVSPVVEHDVDTFEVRLGYRRRFERHGERPVIRMTQRRRLDAFLAEQAANAGVDFRDGVTVGRLATGPDGATADVGGSAVAADFVVAADGANGATARTAGIATDAVRGVALEGNASYDHVDAVRYRGRAVIELAVVPGGYGWVFPKGDHANVGVGGWPGEGPRLREHLARLCTAHGVDSRDLTDVRGHRLPMRRAHSPLADGRTLLVGDAAALVDPLSGDGIYEAWVSAELAAASILEGRPEEYEERVLRALAPHAGASWAAKVALDRYPRITFRIASNARVWDVVEGLLQGDVSHPREARGIARPPLRLLARLARRAGSPDTAGHSV